MGAAAPWLGRTGSPRIIRSVVVFPAPLGPRKPVNGAGGDVEREVPDGPDPGRSACSAPRRRSRALLPLALAALVLDRARDRRARPRSRARPAHPAEHGSRTQSGRSGNGIAGRSIGRAAARSAASARRARSARPCRAAAARAASGRSCSSVLGHGSDARSGEPPATSGPRMVFASDFRRSGAAPAPRRRPAHGLDPVAQPELAQDRRDVRLHRRLGQHEALRDLRVREGERDQPQHLDLTLRQRLQARRRARPRRAACRPRGRAGDA